MQEMYIGNIETNIRNSQSNDNNKIPNPQPNPLTAGPPIPLAPLAPRRPAPPGPALPPRAVPSSSPAVRLAHPQIRPGPHLPPLLVLLKDSPPVPADGRGLGPGQAHYPAVLEGQGRAPGGLV
jgi:hypothetical protein